MDHTWPPMLLGPSSLWSHSMPSCHGVNSLHQNKRTTDSPYKQLHPPPYVLDLLIYLITAGSTPQTGGPTSIHKTGGGGAQNLETFYFFKSSASHFCTRVHSGPVCPDDWQTYIWERGFVMPGMRTPCLGPDGQPLIFLPYFPPPPPHCLWTSW